MTESELAVFARDVDDFDFTISNVTIRRFLATIDALTREPDEAVERGDRFREAALEQNRRTEAAEQRATRAEGVVEAARAFIAMGTDAPIHWQIVRRDALTDALATYDQEDSDGQQEEARTHRGS